MNVDAMSTVVIGTDSDPGHDRPALEPRVASTSTPVTQLYAESGQRG
ncbi:hypothetical protein [Streptomyces wuyuanensis]